MGDTADSRRKKALEYIESHEYTTVKDLVDYLNVSPMTIRRDLILLNQQKSVNRVYGGVVPSNITYNSTNDPGVENFIRLDTNVEEKKILAKKAAELVSDGQIIFLDAGSTCYYIAENLADKKIMVVTNSFTIISLLKNYSNIRLLVLSGEYYQNLDAFIGSIENTPLREIALDIAFIGAAYFNPAKGCFNDTFSEKELKDLVNSNAKESYIVFDSTKTINSSPYLSIPIEKVNNIITTSLVHKKEKIIMELDQKNVNAIFVDA